MKTGLSTVFHFSSPTMPTSCSSAARWSRLSDETTRDCQMSCCSAPPPPESLSLTRGRKVEGGVSLKGQKVILRRHQRVLANASGAPSHVDNIISTGAACPPVKRGTRHRQQWSRRNRGFHVGDVRLGGIRIFDAHIKIQHDAQWRVSNYRSRPITHF